MSSVTKVALAIFVVLVVALAVVYFSWLRPTGEPEGPVEPMEVATPTPLPPPTPTLAERLSERLRGVRLGTSDDAVRELAAEISSHPKLMAWLANEDLVRRFVAGVNNIADGKSPKQHLEFMRPSKPFKAVERYGTFSVDPASYKRYDLATEVFSSLDTEGVAALYHELEPLIDEAHREIAPRGQSFEDRLGRAVQHLLEVPVLDGQPELKEKTVASFAYVDQRLESMSAAQRQLLRMGPDNVRRVQVKLRELMGAIMIESVPEE